MAARLAAVRRDDRDLERLSSAFRTMEEGWETRRFRAADSAFHLGIAEAARNEWMRKAIEDARERTRADLHKIAAANS